jgi:hypothetical protein
MEDIIYGTAISGTYRYKHYCSKKCRTIGSEKYYLLMFWLTFILMIWFPPMWIPLLIFWRRSVKARKLWEEELESKQKLCYYCQANLESLKEEKNICMGCGNPVHYCDLCQNHIFSGEEILQVELCGHVFHKSELLDWSEVNKTCPKCGEKIELIDYSPE